MANTSRAHPQIPTGDDAEARTIWKYLQGDPSGGDDELKGELLVWLIGMNAKMKKAQDSY